MNKTRKWPTRAIYMLIALALVLSFSVVASPVSASSVSEPTVTVSDYTISKTSATYTITFRITTQLDETSDTITVVFPTDTDVTSAAVAGTTGVTFTSGLGYGSGNAGTVGVSATKATRTVVITLTDITPNAIGAQAYVQVIITGITNPSTVGDYTLTVKTTNDTTAATSATYTITAIGAVHVYNAAGNWVNSFSGANALHAANAGQYYDDANYTIEVGPGTYTPDASLTITGQSLTLQGDTANPETVIIAGTSTGDCVVRISASYVTVEGLTVMYSPTNGIGINYATTGVTVRNNIITNGTTGCGIILIYDGAVQTIVDGATVSDNVITKGTTAGYWTGIALMESVKNSVISDNTITDLGEGIVFKGGNTARKTQNNIFTGNTITGCSSSGINLQVGIASGTHLTNNLIKDNTVSENTGIGIKINTGLTVGKLIITGNDITDNIGVGISIASWTAASGAIKFNNIVDNDTTNGYDLQNSSAGAVDATQNWWGSAVATEIAAMIKDVTASDVTDYQPFLTDTVDNVFSATAVDTTNTYLNAATTVGAYVLSSGFGAVYVIGAAKYIANPGGPLDNALAFYNVYVTGTVGTAATDTVILRCYVGDADALLYAWSAGTATWVAVSPAAVFNAFGGFLYVTLTRSAATTPSSPLLTDLDGLAFAVCSAEAVIDVEYYDDDNSGYIEIGELLSAINDYIGGVPGVDISLLLEVINAYISGTPV